MEKITVIMPEYDGTEKTGRFDEVTDFALEGYDTELIKDSDGLVSCDLRGKKVIFAASLGNSGINTELCRMLRTIRSHRNMFDGAAAGVILDGSSELFTKSVARDIVFSANRSGCAFPGRPMVEGTGSLINFNVQAKVKGTDNESAYREAAAELVKRTAEYRPPKITGRRPRLLVLHAGSERTSNTLRLWHMASEYLDCDIREVSLRNGEVWDCRGCSYETCLHFGEKQKCFYGGVVTDEVFPAIKECDGLVMVCPNYNDAVSANLSAFVNRLTAIFRVRPFFDKRVFAVIVSGYSGSDIVAQQLISGLNMNKSFILPPRFALMETANDPGEVMNVDGVEKDAREFAGRIMEEFSS